MGLGTKKGWDGRRWRSVGGFVAVVLVALGAGATENGASVYPVGVETVMPGMTPPPRGTMLFEFTTFYEASELDNSQGRSETPEFKVRVVANAFKLEQNWNLRLLGGWLNSNIAVPELYQQLHVAPGRFTGSGLGNVDIGVFQLGYQAGAWHWFYEGDVFLPGGSYTPGAVLNVGQHNDAAAPVGGVTFLPHEGRTELSSKLLYIVNFHDPATAYRSGNELVWEYDGMQEVSRGIALGANGYFYQQTTDDLEKGLRVGDGNRGRDLAVGPEVRIAIPGHGAIAMKYERDTLVENKPRGNAFWFQMGIPMHWLWGGMRL